MITCILRDIPQDAGLGCCNRIIAHGWVIVSAGIPGRTASVNDRHRSLTVAALIGRSADQVPNAPLFFHHSSLIISYYLLPLFPLDMMIESLNENDSFRKFIDGDFRR